MYKEDFAVANTSTLGSTFTLVSGTHQRIVSQAAVGAASGTSGGFYRYTGKMASDHMRIDTSLITPPAGTLSTSIGLFLLTRMPDTFATAGAAGTYAAAGIGSAGGWSLQTVNQTTFTSRASGMAGALSLPGVFSFIAAGPTYTMLWNGSPITGATWTDTNNAVASIGTTKRNVGVIVQCSATNMQHPGLDWVAAHDMAGQFFAG